MSTHVEHSIECVRLSDKVAQLLCVLPQRLLLLQELGGLLIALEHLDGRRIQWSCSSLGRSNHNLGFAFELVVWMSELRQVPACGLASVAHLVMAAEHEEDLWQAAIGLLVRADHVLCFVDEGRHGAG